MKNLIKQKYKLRVFAADGELRHESRWRENLILDAGLTDLANATDGTAGFFTQASLGGGNSANQVASSPVTFTQSGTAITASGSFFTTGMTGALLKYGTGSAGAEVYLTYVDATHATANVAHTQSATVGTVYFVAQTKLKTWLLNKNAYNSVGNSTTQNFSGGGVVTVTHQREFIFNQQGSPYTINEIGWGTDASSNPDIYGRAVLPSPVVIATTDYVILTVQIIFTLSPPRPASSSAGDQVFNQFKGTATTAPTFALEVWDTTVVNSDGSTGTGNGAILDKTYSSIYFILITDTAFVQNANTGASYPSVASFYYATGSLAWAQVGGQNPGVSQLTLSGLNFTTNGEKLIGVGVGYNSGNIDFDICANYSDLSLTTDLPVGNFQLSATWQMVWARELSN